MRLLPRSYGVTALALALAWSGWFLCSATCCPAAEGGGLSEFSFFDDPPAAYDFKLGTLDGRIFNLSDLKGNVVILNFWKSNCPYCVEEKGLFRKMLAEMKRPDLAVVCVNLWDDPSWVKKYAAQHHEELFLATRPDNRKWVQENIVKGRVASYFIVNEAREAIYEVSGFPSTYVIDKEGRVVAGHVGMARWDSQGVRRWVSGLLGPLPTAPTPGDQADQHLSEWMDRLLAGPVQQGQDAR